MKTKVKVLTKVNGVGEIETPENNPLLLHFLSPLELAAYKHKFKRFTYNLDGVLLEIEPRMAKALFYRSRKNVNGLRDILQESLITLLKRADPNFRRFLIMPLKNHNLPTRLYHILLDHHCRNMAEVAEKGEHGLKRMKGMGNDSVTYIMNLFIENGCGSLFI